MNAIVGFFRRSSELFNPGAGAILVFLCGPTANAAGTDQDTLAEDRHGALAIGSRWNTSRTR